MHLTPESGDPLQGTWSATRWQYTAPPDLARDVVCDLGGSVTLSLGADSYVLACDAPNSRTIEGGAFTIAGDSLELHSHSSDAVRSLRWRLVDDTLTLRSDATNYDFDDSHPNEPAALVAVLVRF